MFANESIYAFYALVCLGAKALKYCATLNINETNNALSLGKRDFYGK